MSLALLGEGFELHGGGNDLKFPHHENERAQAVAAGRRFASHWVHNGMVEIGGEKMSKSLGNFTNLADLLDSSDPRAYRLLVLQCHYRAPMEVGPAALAAATQTLERLDSLARRVDEAALALDAGDVDRAWGDLEARFRERMDDDLDTPRATALVFDAVRSANAALDDGDTVGGVARGREALECAEAVGLRTSAGGAVSTEALELARRRDEARAGRDFAAADAIRDRLVELGYRVEDTASGTRLSAR
jgi:cysteinyl-tRNA synthetase